ncbi:Heavy-metal-associated domain protein [compost metagenome]
MMLARSVARLTETVSTPGTAFSALSIRPTQEAQVMPSIGSDIALEKSVARTVAYIAASFSRSEFQVRTEAEASSHGKVNGQVSNFAPLDPAMVGSPTLSIMRPKPRRNLMELRIESMTCGGCARSVTRAIQSVDPNARIETDPASRMVKIETTATSTALQQVLEEAGYPATVN